jgi:hypothetical protein
MSPEQKKLSEVSLPYRYQKIEYPWIYPLENATSIGCFNDFFSRLYPDKEE